MPAARPISWSLGIHSLTIKIEELYLAMANSYAQIYIQAVFAVKYRQALISKEWNTKLHAVIGQLINETGCKTIIVNGVEDHVHCFFRLARDCSVADVMKSVKAKSSKWINESNLLPVRFEWQKGYGAFSYSQSAIKSVVRYIQNKEAHHAKQTFAKEYVQMLDAFEVNYDEVYLFQKPE